MDKELINIFTNIKKTVCNTKTVKYDVSEVFKYIETADINDEMFKNISIYVFAMKYSIEAIGTDIIKMNRYMELFSENSDNFFTANQNDFESVFKEIIENIDNFTDSIVNLFKLIGNENQEFDFMKTSFELKAKRDMLVASGNEYTAKLIRGKKDSNTFVFYINDFIDTMLNESYKLQLNNMARAIKTLS